MFYIILELEKSPLNCLFLETFCFKDFFQGTFLGPDFRTLFPKKCSENFFGDCVLQVPQPHVVVSENPGFSQMYTYITIKISLLNILINRFVIFYIPVSYQGKHEYGKYI